MQIKLLFGLDLHFGTPKNRLEMRAWTGSLAYRPDKEKPSIVRHDYISHKIERWYGITYKRAWFFGLTCFGITTEERVPNLPSYIRGDERKQWDDYDNWPLVEDITDE